MAAQHEVVKTGGMPWAESTLEAARALLDSDFSHLSLHCFLAEGRSRQIMIALDKYSDSFGSPSVDEITEFAESLTSRLEDQIGSDEVGNIKFEISSPGAEREIRMFELHRFRHLPIKVRSTSSTQILTFVDSDNDCTTWRLASVKSNRGKSKKNEEISIRKEDIIKLELFIDI